MTEPVLMGVIVLPEDVQQHGQETEIIVGPSSSSSSSSPLQPPPSPSSSTHLPRRNESPSSDASSDRTIQPPRADSSGSQPDSDSDDDGEGGGGADFEISASFLQQALLGPSSSSSDSNNNPSTFTTSLDSSPSFSLASINSDHPRLLPKALDRPLSRREGGRGKEDDEIAWVRTRVLGEVGAFDGDWVSKALVYPSDLQEKNERGADFFFPLLRIRSPFAQRKPQKMESLLFLRVLLETGESSGYVLGRRRRFLPPSLLCRLFLTKLSLSLLPRADLLSFRSFDDQIDPPSSSPPPQPHPSQHSQRQEHSSTSPTNSVSTLSTTSSPNRLVRHARETGVSCVYQQAPSASGRSSTSEVL